MGGFSILHILLVSIIALIFFGPSRLPALGQALGKSINGFKSALKEIDRDDSSPSQISSPSQVDSDKQV